MTASRQEEIDRNFEEFQRQLPVLLEKYRGKYALMRNQEIKGYYDTAVDANLTGEQMFPDKLFSVQQVIDTAVDLGFFSHAMHMGAT
jgi:hypothetical protein